MLNGFWFPWMTAFLGFPIGGGLALVAFGPMQGPKQGILGGMLAGAIIGGAQWLAMRKWLPLSAVWIPVTAFAMGAGLAAGLVLFGKETTYGEISARGALTGLAVGLAQYTLLREQVHGSVWWIPVIAVAWAVGWCVTKAFGVNLARDFAVFGSTGAFVFQGLAGFALMLMKGGRVP